MEQLPRGLGRGDQSRDSYLMFCPLILSFSLREKEPSFFLVLIFQKPRR
jgi:hypothetical protein